MKRTISKASEEPQGTRTVQRALSLLDFFTAEKPTWGLSELSSARRLDKATTLRLLRTLEHLDVLVPAGFPGRYAMGPKVLRWAEALGSSAQLKSAAGPVVDALCRQIQETVTLAIVSGDSRIAVLARQSPQPVRRVVETYLALPLYCGAPGKAILSTYSDDALSAYLSRVRLNPFTQFTITSEKTLRAELQSTRRRGYAISTGERVADAAGIAMAIKGKLNVAVGALAISFPAFRFNNKQVQRWAALLNDAVAVLEKSLV